MGARERAGERGGAMTNKHDIIRVHRQHPTWCANEIAAHLGCMAAYVRATARRDHLPIPLQTRPIRGPETLEQLGRAARTAGLTVADIAKIANARRVHRTAMAEAVE